MPYYSHNARIYTLDATEDSGRYTNMYIYQRHMHVIFVTTKCSCSKSLSLHFVVMTPPMPRNNVGMGITTTALGILNYFMIFIAVAIARVVCLGTLASYISVWSLGANPHSTGSGYGCRLYTHYILTFSQLDKVNAFWRCTRQRGAGLPGSATCILVYFNTVIYTVH